MVVLPENSKSSGNRHKNTGDFLQEEISDKELRSAIIINQNQKK